VEAQKAYIRERVREIVPFVRECYDDALARDPELGGRVTVSFTIEGEPDVGGVIGTSDVDEAETTVDDPEFVACVEETMYTIEVAPPAGGGAVLVRFPFEFSTE